MKIKKQLIFLLVMVMLVLSLTGCENKKNKEIKFGTGGTGGNYYSYGTNLADALDKKDLNVTVKATAGSSANIRLLNQGFLDLAIVQGDIFKEAVKDGTERLHALTGLYDESVQIVVPADSDIKTVADLKGRTVSLGEEESGAYKNALDIFKAYNISTDLIETKYLSYKDAAEALEKGEIDAFFCTASFPTTSVAELAKSMDIRILSIDADTLCNDDLYKKCVIKAGTYNGQTEDITTISVTAILVASDSLDKDIEETILAVLRERNEELKQISFGVPAEAKDTGIRTIPLNMYLTLALAVLVLYLGAFLKKKINFLEKFCIPAPVIGGIIFAIVSSVLHATGVVEFTFDETLKNVCMIIFFTSVGFQANFKILRKGGVGLVVFLICVLVLIISQNGLAIGMSKLLKIDPLVGLCTGSIPMVGGHGTAGAFGLVLEDLGLKGATTLSTAAATFGLVMGSLMGGPIGRALIEKHKLLDTAVKEDASVLIEEGAKHHRKASMYAPAAYQIAIAMGVGTIISELLSKTGMTFPIYIGAMIMAAIMRNVSEYSGKYTVHMGEINDIGGICLSLFLGIAMVTLKLWQLADLALPLFVLLIAQTLFMALFSYFIVFNVMGRNYDAAVLAAGTCGFGMGATPNAMANMQAITAKYAPSVQAYILVPIVGSMFADFINTLVVTFFINML